MIGSLWIWISTTLSLIVALPVVGLFRLLDKDPARYRAGLWFRRIGSLPTRLTPLWRIRVEGADLVTNPRNPYVVVSNHQSLVDIPVISRLPWEMKWVAKKELFDLPLIGWLMKWAGDIAVDRSSKRSRAKVLIDAAAYLRVNCSVMFFPEGTRSEDGTLGEFNSGAFHLAIKEHLPILPLVIDGTSNALQKGSWRFNDPGPIYLKVLPPVSTEGLTKDDANDLTLRVRGMIDVQLREWRGEPVQVAAAHAVDDTTGNSASGGMAANPGKSELSGA